MNATRAIGVAVAVVAMYGTASANPEMLTERCSGEVAFAPTHGGAPTDHGSVVLKRGGGGHSPWTTVRVKPDKDGFVRWWCHSTTGNVFDLGTWRVKVNGRELEACLISAADPIEAEVEGHCEKTIKIKSSAFEGWTPERSRCGNHGGHLKARLGADRKLEIECL